ncbi:MAG: hypothetical protein U5K71_14370 [Gracilimonas sp.]|nr:hypothetical protein [Gracilimonas sp.]
MTIIGLGSAGLPPRGRNLQRNFPTVGFDINKKRGDELNRGHDRTLEVSDKELSSVLVPDFKAKATGLKVSYNSDDLKDCNVFIVTVPTPTDKHNRPVLAPLLKASENIGKYLKKGDVVIYESTVYPGVTESRSCRYWKRYPD